VQSWRGDASLAAGARQGYLGILSAPYYLDAQKTAEMMFLADPIPADTKLTAEEQKRIWGGEICMWGEHIDSETVDSRVWPRSLAIAERFWSPQGDRDVADMYRRLRVASLELEDVGLTHIIGPKRLRRNLAGSADPEALDVMAAVVEPATFSERYNAQHTDRLTSLDRMIDAVVPDPPARQEIAVLVAGALGGDAGAAMKLRRRFESWQDAAPQIQARSAGSARLSELDVRARQLGQLGTAGLEALAFIQMNTAAPGAWVDAEKALIVEAGKPSGMVRFVFLPEMGKLVEAAGGAAAANRP
jgi:hexosaminidase